MDHPIIALNKEKRYDYKFTFPKGTQTTTRKDVVAELRMMLYQYGDLDAQEKLSVADYKSYLRPYIRDYLFGQHALEVTTKTLTAKKNIILLPAKWLNLNTDDDFSKIIKELDTLLPEVGNDKLILDKADIILPPRRVLDYDYLLSKVPSKFQHGAWKAVIWLFTRLYSICIAEGDTVYTIQVPLVMRATAMTAIVSEQPVVDKKANFLFNNILTLCYNKGGKAYHPSQAISIDARELIALMPRPDTRPGNRPVFNGTIPHAVDTYIGMTEGRIRTLLCETLRVAFADLNYTIPSCMDYPMRLCRIMANTVALRDARGAPEYVQQKIQSRLVLLHDHRQDIILSNYTRTPHESYTPRLDVTVIPGFPLLRLLDACLEDVKCIQLGWIKSGDSYMHLLDGETMTEFPESTPSRPVSDTLQELFDKAHGVIKAMSSPRDTLLKADQAWDNISETITNKQPFDEFFNSQKGKSAEEVFQFDRHAEDTLRNLAHKISVLATLEGFELVPSSGQKLAPFFPSVHTPVKGSLTPGKPCEILFWALTDPDQNYRVIIPALVKGSRTKCSADNGLYKLYR